MFYALPGSGTSTLPSAASASPLALVSQHSHFLPDWDLCVGVCSSLWQHRAAKKFCPVVLLGDALGIYQEAATKKWVQNGLKRLKISDSQISASSTLKCSNICKSYWLSKSGDHWNVPGVNEKFSLLCNSWSVWSWRPRMKASRIHQKKTSVLFLKVFMKSWPCNSVKS